MTTPDDLPPAPALSKKEAKAQAAAAAAYAKSQKNWIFRHKILSGALVLVALIVIGAAAGGGGGNSGTLTGQKSTVTTSTGSKTSTAPKNAAIGQGLHVTGDNGLDATVTLTSFAVHPKGTGDLAEAPKNGTYAVGKFVIDDTAGSYDFNPLYLKYQTADGTTYGALDGNASTAGFDPMLDSGTLSAGQKTGGYVTFDVPAGHGLIQLTDPLGGVVGQWAV